MSAMQQTTPPGAQSPARLLQQRFGNLGTQQFAKKLDLKLHPSSVLFPPEDLLKPVPPKPAAKPAKPLDIETSIEASLAERKVTSNVEVAVPILPVKGPLIFGEPIVLWKELKAGVEIGEDRKQAALKVSLKAVTYEIEKLKFKGLKELTAGITAEASLDTAAALRPDVSVRAGVEASYQPVPAVPLFIEAKAGYEVTLPTSGQPISAAPKGDISVKVKF